MTKTDWKLVASLDMPGIAYKGEAWILEVPTTRHRSVMAWIATDNRPDERRYYPNGYLYSVTIIHHDGQFEQIERADSFCQTVTEAKKQVTPQARIQAGLEPGFR